MLANRNNLNRRLSPTALCAMTLVVASMDAGPLAAIATIADAPAGVAVAARQVSVQPATTRSLRAPDKLPAPQETSAAR